MHVQDGLPARSRNACQPSESGGCLPKGVCLEVFTGTGTHVQTSTASLGDELHIAGNVTRLDEVWRFCFGATVRPSRGFMNRTMSLASGGVSQHGRAKQCGRLRAHSAAMNAASRFGRVCAYTSCVRRRLQVCWNLDVRGHGETPQRGTWLLGPVCWDAETDRRSSLDDVTAS